MDEHDAPGRKVPGVDIQVLHGVLDDGGLVVLVVDNEVPVEADGFAAGSQNPDADGVERAEGEPLGVLTHEIEHPLPHLPGSLVGEGHGHHPARVHADHPHQVGDAGGDDSGLAASRTSEDEQRPVDVLYGFLLGWVQAFQQVVCDHCPLIIATGSGGGVW